MACTPPYCGGTGWCNCCNCCPPDPCYTSWTYKYLCGSGNPCASFMPNLGIEFPDFDPVEFQKEFTFRSDFGQWAEDYETESEAVFRSDAPGPGGDVPGGGGGPGGACDIGVTTVTVTISTSGCCMTLVPRFVGDYQSFKAVGAGGISIVMTYSGNPLLCDNPFSEFMISLNTVPKIGIGSAHGCPGSCANPCSPCNGDDNGIGGTPVANCEPFIIGITFPSPVTMIPCCNCCPSESSGVLLNEPLGFRRQADGRIKMLINPLALKKGLIQRMLKSKQ